MIIISRSKLIKTGRKCIITYSGLATITEHRHGKTSFRLLYRELFYFVRILLKQFIRFHSLFKGCITRIESILRRANIFIQKIKFRFTLIILSAATLFLSGCLLAMGTPLARRVEPGNWNIEGGAGITGTTDTSSEITAGGIAAYLYAGRALGKHFEIGVPPYYYGFVIGSTSYNPSNVAAIYVPLKWDPFNYDFPFHLTLNAGPVLFAGDVSGPSIVGGLGLSYYFSNSFEFYASLSATQMVQLFTASLGARYAINRRLQVGALILFSYPDLSAAEITVGTKLGK